MDASWFTPGVMGVLALGEGISYTDLVAMKSMVFPIVVEQDEDGFYVDCPSLQGCHAQGRTYEEALANIRDAVELHIEDRKASGEPIPTPGKVSVTTLEVSA